MLPPWQKRHFLIFRSSEASDGQKTAKFGIDHTTENRKSRLAVCGKTIAPALSDDAERGDGKDFRKRNVRTNRRVCRYQWDAK